MKYEDIKVGESYEYGLSIEKVISKIDEYRAVITVGENGDVFALNEDELEHFQPIKKELPESGLLVCTDGAIVYRTCKYSGFGFLNEVYEIHDGWTFGSSVTVWRIATPEDKSKFIKLLEAEAEKHGLGVDVKIKGHADVFDGSLNENQYVPNFTTVSAWNKNGCIFYNGIWAEPMSAEPKTSMVKNPNYYCAGTYAESVAEDFALNANFSYIADSAKKNSQEINTEERIKQLEDKVEEFNSRIKGLITCFNNITKRRDKEPEKKKAWWRN